MAYNTDKTFTENFTDHPMSHGMSYPIHLIYAWALAAEAFVYSLTFFTHGILPFLFKDSGSAGIKKMAEILERDGEA